MSERPDLWEAFEDYRINGNYFSKQDMDTLKNIIQDLLKDSELTEKIVVDKMPQEWQDRVNADKPCREASELINKFKHIGLIS